MRKSLFVAGAALSLAVASGSQAYAAPPAATTTPGGTAAATPSHSPKGHPPVPGVTTPRAKAAAVSFLYGTANQFAVAQGTTANVTVAKPFLAPADYHSLVELAAQSADGRQIVEVGSTVDRGVNGDAEPHLFVYHWVNGQPSCYNGCGFVQVSSVARAGMALTPGSTPQLTIQHFQGNWWLGFNSDWVGYFPDSLWSGGFTQTGLVQWFGEVSASSAAPCTDMGNGQFAASASAASISNIGFLSGPAVNVAASATSPSYYTALRTSANSIRYGGPGAC